MSVIKPSMEWMLIFPEKEQPSNPETDYGRKEKSLMSSLMALVRANNFCVCMFCFALHFSEINTNVFKLYVNLDIFVQVSCSLESNICNT